MLKFLAIQLHTANFTKMLGRYSAGFTLDTYTRVTASAKREAANTMGGILSGAIR